jgi:hypothetical protein
MIEIKDLLARFNTILASEEIKSASVASVLEQVIGVKVKKEDIKIKNNTVYLNIKPIYKNEIFLHKDRIDSLLEMALGKKTPDNIR